MLGATRIRNSKIAWPPTLRGELHLAWPPAVPVLGLAPLLLADRNAVYANASPHIIRRPHPG
eukprot:3031303-Lingulodinium_polyedra.AAC.1